MELTGPHTLGKREPAYLHGGFSSMNSRCSRWNLDKCTEIYHQARTDMGAGENIMMRVDDAFVPADEDVRKDYGEDFLKKFKTVGKRAFPPSPNMHKLLGDIESAVTLKRILILYTKYIEMHLSNLFLIFTKHVR
ncbi:hypothetical protein AVEN_218477-1 [Araneus ventricosus]|uniref:Uncharacterized protein n=1 Tax=Araneus ventricosus TaxID=182803 RepID=A0A4Y2SLH4_ARAVE|nr:hypothetical protein AVEN_218477-1 [Araneus ventricosus]